MFNKTRYLELEKLSQDLAKDGKSLFKDRRNEYDELQGFHIVLFHDIFWRRRNKFILLMKQFLNGSLDIEQFETKFSLLYKKTQKTFHKFKKNLKQIEKWEFDPIASECKFSSFIVSIFRLFETLEDEECSEQDVKNLVRNNLISMQSYL